MALWQDIFDSLSDGVIVLSDSLEPIALNPAAEAMLGASGLRAAAVARLIGGNEWLRRMVNSCLRGGQIIDDPENVMVVGARQLAVRAAVSPLLNRQGRSEGAIILLHDLALQKNAEHALGPSQSPLKLSPAGLAHEVKNPLTGIKGAAELLSAMFPDDERARQYCGLILNGVNRIAALVEEVLAMSAPLRLKREPVNIHRVLHEALAIAGLYPQAPATITVERLFDPSLPEVSGDGAALERVFLNLIKNAAEALEADSYPGGTKGVPCGARQPHPGSGGTGGGRRERTIRLSTRMETQFRLTAQGRHRRFLRVEISDNGKGMTPEEVDQLFTPFFTTKASGTGLGLALSQRIVALHEGKLWAERGGVVGKPVAHHDLPGVEGGDRAQRRGMTFYVSLPVWDDFSNDVSEL